MGIAFGEVGVGDADGEADGDMCWRASSRELQERQNRFN